MKQQTAMHLERVKIKCNFYCPIFLILTLVILVLSLLLGNGYTCWSPLNIILVISISIFLLLELFCSVLDMVLHYYWKNNYKFRESIKRKEVKN